MKCFFVLLFHLSLLTVSASCGLENCKRLDFHDKKIHQFEIDFKTRHTNFSFESEDGYYIDYKICFSYSFRNSLSIELNLPFTVLKFDNKETSGFSNPNLNFRNRFDVLNLNPFIGLQVELPLGEDEKGITADHYELLPHIGIAKKNEYFSFLVSAGYRFSLSDNEVNHDTTSSGKKFHGEEIHAGVAPTLGVLAQNYVNFHGKEEIQLYSSWLKHFTGQKFSLGLHATLRQVTAGQEKYFLAYGGPEVLMNIKSFQFELSSDIPVSSDKKMNWQLGFQIGYVF